MMALAHHVHVPQAPLAYQPAFTATSYETSETAAFDATTFATSAFSLIDLPTSTPSSSVHNHHPPEAPGLFQSGSSANLVGASTPSRAFMAGEPKCSAGLLSAFLSYFTLSSIRHLDNGRNLTDSVESSHWLTSPSSWMDRQTCRWLGKCDTSDMDEPGHSSQQEQQRLQEPEALDAPPDFSSLWESGHVDERLLRQIPSYVYDYTPYVHLFSGEEFWPCDIGDHLLHTTPHLNYTRIGNMTHRTLDNLDDLNQFTRFTYLQSNDNVEERPNWLGGGSNIPNSPSSSDGEDGFPGPLSPPVGPAVSVLDEKDWHEVGVGDIRAHGGIRPNPPRSTTDTNHGKETSRNPDERKAGRGGGRSSAPAVLVVVPKEHGVVDAFWFYFYSFNQGNQVLNVRFGNHVGDWEHSVVRFQHGVPKAVFLSEHNFGEAYSYGAVEKIGKRPVIYSAVGTHANYATPGLHPYVLPWGLLHDETDRGPLWDPLKNHHAYVYNYTSGHLRSSTQTPDAPVSWFNFRGRWGDKFYPMSDSRQYQFAGQYHYVSGPLGPKFKNLGRKTVCQGNDKCVIKHWLGGGRIKSWPGKSDDPEQDWTQSQPESTR